MTSLGFGDHGEDPRLTCHKVSGSSLAIARFIGSKSIFECDGALLDLWRLFDSFSGATIVAVEKDGRCFGEAQVSSRMNL
jgi:hypothetical protein